uniref:Uncharacterized protein n=1 Tax=Romanomermis culicivorax TaxID=13658 RepID=A0A915KNP9_ROMCU
MLNEKWRSAFGVKYEPTEAALNALVGDPAATENNHGQDGLGIGSDASKGDKSRLVTLAMKIQYCDVSTMNFQNENGIKETPHPKILESVTPGPKKSPDPPEFRARYMYAKNAFYSH